MRLGRRNPYYGVTAEFETVDGIVGAAERAREAGYKRIDAYTPFPIHGLSDIVGFRDERVPIFMFVGGVVGCLSGLALQIWTNAIDYPVNVGGRPLVGWPAFIPVTFECTVLFSALTGALGMIIMNGLPKPHDPMFGVPGFERASQDRFFLLIEANDPNFRLDETTRFMEGLGAVNVTAVEKE